MNDPYHSPASDVRIGDADRDHAIRLLGVHFADGRITLTEYDDRCRIAVTAKTRVELNNLFVDLPALPNAQPGTSIEVYSAAEIAEQRRRGANPRAGIMALTSIAAIFVASLLDGVSAMASNAAVLVIPAVAVLLYVLKVGPETWYTPSPRTLERARAKKFAVNTSVNWKSSTLSEKSNRPNSRPMPSPSRTGR